MATSVSLRFYKTDKLSGNIFQKDCHLGLIFVVSHFPIRTFDGEIYAVLADDEANQLFVGSTEIVGKDFPSLTPRCPQVHLFEREMAEQFDLNKGFLNGPFFTMFRTKSIPKFRTNPAYKPVVYTIPKKKANGIVYEEWLGRGPLRYELMYELKFISNFREYTNHFETQIREYFCNKRNIIICNNERFSIGPADQDTLAELEIVDRDDVQEGTLYVLTFSLKLECFTRDMENIQKRERHNKYTQIGRAHV